MPQRLERGVSQSGPKLAVVPKALLSHRLNRERLRVKCAMLIRRPSASPTFLR